MLAIIKAWGRRYLSDPQAILLGGLLIGGVILLMAMGQILAPLIASIVIAYLLKSVVLFLKKRGIPDLYSVLLVYCAFLGLFLVAILILWPIIWQQMLRLYQELPSMIAGFQNFLILLPEKFPEFLTKETVENGMSGFLNQLKYMGSILVTASLASLPTLITLIVYLFLVPLMVFFFLKDDKVILRWFANFLPKDRSLLTQVWRKVDKQIGNYIRGKVLEVIIVGVVTYIAFYFFHTGYAALLAALVGFSVLIPYVGAVVVTVPVVLVAFFQWGLGSTLAYFLVVYGVIQAIDGTLLVPLLFSGAVSLHPIAIISAVLIFGGWWGFWGVFFAIPLAALVKAVLETWPKREV